MKSLVTVSTAEGIWAPPHYVQLAVTNKTPSGLGITNATEVRWHMEGHAEITHGAILMGNGAWAHLDLNSQMVIAGQDVVIHPGAFMINVELTLLPGLAQSRLKSAQRQLEKR